MEIQDVEKTLLLMNLFRLANLKLLVTNGSLQLVEEPDREIVTCNTLAELGMYLQGAADVCENPERFSWLRTMNEKFKEDPKLGFIEELASTIVVR